MVLFGSYGLQCNNHIVLYLLYLNIELAKKLAINILHKKIETCCLFVNTCYVSEKTVINKKKSCAWMSLEYGWTKFLVSREVSAGQNQ